MRDCKDCTHCMVKLQLVDSAFSKRKFPLYRFENVSIDGKHFNLPRAWKFALCEAFNKKIVNNFMAGEGKVRCAKNKWIDYNGEPFTYSNLKMFNETGHSMANKIVVSCDSFSRG